MPKTSNEGLVNTFQKGRMSIFKIVNENKDCPTPMTPILNQKRRKLTLKDRVKTTDFDD
jgi:hypothetical protein